MKYNKHIPQVKNIGLQNNFHYQNKLGLDKAYASDNKLYVDNGTLYVAGTSNLQDVWDDVKIPFGLTRFSQRYKDASNVLKDNPQITKVTGHSLGSAVSDELAKRNKDRGLKTTLYGSPFFQIDGSKSENRWRHPNDLISMFDSGAITTGPPSMNLLKQHSYANYD